MRIESKEGKPLHAVTLFLTEPEAHELRDSLDSMLATREEQPLRHEHVSSGDYQSEVTVAWDLPAT